jgi:hypothetical protein
VTLIIGVLVSMFTAVLATRAMLGLLSDLPFFGRASFMGVRAPDAALATETQVDLAPAATRPSASPSASKSGGGRSTASRKKKKRR